MTEFKIGDKVEDIFAERSGEIAAEAMPAVVVRFDDGEHDTVFVSRLEKRVPVFKAGDRVMWDEYPVVVVAGPFTNARGFGEYVTSFDGELALKPANELGYPDGVLPSPAPLAVGDRIRILEDEHNGACVVSGEILRVSSRETDTVFGALAEGDSDDVPAWIFEYAAEGTGWERVN